MSLHVVAYSLKDHYIYYSRHVSVIRCSNGYLQKAVALAPESESGHHRAATAVATAVRARSGASDSSHSSTGCPVPPGRPANSTLSLMALLC